MTDDIVVKCLRSAIEGARINGEDAKHALSQYKKLISKDGTAKKDHLIMKLQNEVSELTQRLSTLAGNTLMDGNPAIADLSDPFRPTKIVEQFHEVYSNEWTDAYEEIKHTYSGQKEEFDIPQMLADICKEIFDYCRKVADQQFEVLSSYTHGFMQQPTYKWNGYAIGSKKADDVDIDMTSASQACKQLKYLRKTLSRSSLPAVMDIFSSISKNVGLRGRGHNSAAMTAYVNRLLELCWLMNVQDPQLSLLWLDKGTNAKNDKFAMFTRTGTVVELTVWPAVLLHENGPLMDKGVVHVA